MLGYCVVDPPLTHNPHGRSLDGKVDAVIAQPAGGVARGQQRDEPAGEVQHGGEHDRGRREELDLVRDHRGVRRHSGAKRRNGRNGLFKKLKFCNFCLTQRAAQDIQERRRGAASKIAGLPGRLINKVQCDAQ